MDVENGYYGKSFRLYPPRIWASKSEAALQLSLATDILDQDYFCQGPMEGYKVRYMTVDES